MTRDDLIEALVASVGLTSRDFAWLIALARASGVAPRDFCEGASKFYVNTYLAAFPSTIHTIN